ncbi:LuxR C-terminal-related transcriptional regulator [Humibacillus xanthopallidus]|uniref:LuxR family two component transcriptional regulator n=1 Tax=Humibacillus xanthopallidus TaxID=412689 RepID=A0A543I1S4_9MICO|nr:response regulator transcription factor [Humibacillus xanthopallidus]TQM64534.1 LuxR family two component transcriptional regulator [Humibacillus xanthopallidus]
MRIVVADDHQVLLDTLSASLTERGHDVVAREVTSEGALDAVLALDPDACLLDYSYPGGTCHAALSSMTACRPRTHVVVLSASSEPGVVAGVLAAGATGFVSKTRSIDEICDALARAARGQVAVDARLLQQALAAPSAKGPLWSLRFLTEREWDVLKCLTRGLTTKQIACELGIRHATARTHVQHLLAKLGVHSRLEAAALMTKHADSKTWPLRLRE